ncbi:MAG: hypothetical protein U0361_02815 [Nitrospiraceae bacterium]
MVFSETLTGTVAGGPRHITFRAVHAVGSLSDSVWVWVFSASFEKKWEDWRVKAEAGREINPSGFGLLLRTDKFSLELSHQFTERLTASLNGMFLVADSIKTATVRTNFPENRLIYITPKPSWRISEWWTMTCCTPMPSVTSRASHRRHWRIPAASCSPIIRPSGRLGGNRPLISDEGARVMQKSQLDIKELIAIALWRKRGRWRCARPGFCLSGRRLRSRFLPSIARPPRS